MVEPGIHAPAPVRALDLLAAGEQDAGRPGHVIGHLRFGVESAARNAVGERDSRVVRVPLPVIEGPATGDIWLSALPVHSGSSDGIHHADNGEILFGWLQLPESELSTLERAAYDTHIKLYELLDGLGFPHGLRVWNYLSSINEGVDDRERYREFTVGRHEALARTPEFKRLLPAATGIGTPSGTGLTIAFFAAKAPGVQVENPRQTSAFEYPRLYGPRSPSFSRATLQRHRDGAWLFVSGTASIVGHATAHPGDPIAQFDETLRNLDALLEHASRRHTQGQGREHFKPRAYKLYVRSPDVLQALGDRWQAALRCHAPTTVLLGDLCRRDLLLEIEAVYALTP